MSEEPKRSLLKKIFKRKQTKSKDLTIRQVLSVSKKRSFPTLRQWLQLSAVLNQSEKRILFGAFSLLVFSTVALGAWYFITHRVEIPTVGGEYTEALIGEPQLINPLYATLSDTDADITSLIYSGLLKWDPQETLVNDLAETLDISEDGTTYTVRIRDDARFHNGEDVRARDILFTVNAIQNLAYRSPLEVSFRGVSVSQVDDKTVVFVLEEPFAPFLSTLTTGILPANVWAGIAPKNALLTSLNLEPIGSGPYKFAEFSKDKGGSILSYTLKRNAEYYGDGPLIEKITFKFYKNNEAAVSALANRNVEGVSFIPPELEEEVNKIRSVKLLRPTMPRETVLYFNKETQPIFENDNVRKAFAHALNREAIIQDVLGGNGTAIHAPILPGMVGYHQEVAKIELDRVAAGVLLEEEDYVLQEGATFRTDPGIVEGDDESDEEVDTDLTFTIKTVQNAEFVRVAELIAAQMESIGIKIIIDVIEPEIFFEKIVTPRDYEILLTGVLLGADSDPYPFWHSSQTGTNGLNLAGYANRNVDDLLEEARRTTNEEERSRIYREFQDVIAEDIPAIFLYQSTYTYALPNKINNVVIERITSLSDRYSSITSWYIKTKKALR